MAHTAPILLTELNLITNYLLYFCLLLNLYFFSKEGLGQLHLSVGMLLNAPMGKTVCKIYFLGFNITWTLLHKASPKSIAQLRHAEDTFLKVPIAFSAGNKLWDREKLKFQYCTKYLKMLLQMFYFIKIIRIKILTYHNETQDRSYWKFCSIIMKILTILNKSEPFIPLC